MKLKKKNKQNKQKSQMSCKNICESQYLKEA